MSQQVEVKLIFPNIEAAVNFLRDKHDPGSPISSVSVVPIGSLSGAAQQAVSAPAVGLEDVRKAMTGYISKGGGRTAATAKAILEENGIAALKEAKLEQYPTLLHAFETR